MPISVMAHATRRLFVPLLFVGVLVLAGCMQTPPTGGIIGNYTTAPNIDQQAYCRAGEDLNYPDEKCVPGQKIIYWAGLHFDQSLALFAAINCDMRYSIVTAGGAIACIYAPIDPANNLARKMKP